MTLLPLSALVDPSGYFLYDQNFMLLFKMVMIRMTTINDDDDDDNVMMMMILKFTVMSLSPHNVIIP